MNDPFEQFERSRLGLTIPLLLFLVGAVPTALAIDAMISIRANQVQAEVEVLEPRAAEPAAEPALDPITNPQDTTNP